MKNVKVSITIIAMLLLVSCSEGPTFCSEQENESLALACQEGCDGSLCVELHDERLSRIGCGDYCEINARSLALNYNGTVLAIANWDGVRLYSVLTGDLLQELPGCGTGMWMVSFSPDERWLASINAKGETKLWDLANGRVIDTLSAGSCDGVLWTVAGTGVSFSADGSHIVAWANTYPTELPVQVWESASGELVTSFMSSSVSGSLAAISPDGQRLILDDSNGLQVIDRRSLELLLELEDSQLVSYVVFSADNQRIYGINWFNGDISAWDAQTCEKVHSVNPCRETRGEAGECWALDAYHRFGLSGDGSRLVGYSGTTVHVWDTQTWEVMRTFHGSPGSWIKDLVMSGDGERVAALEYDGVIRMWYLAP